MAASIPFAINLVTNPKPASLTGISFSGATGALAYERSYSGSVSVRAVFPASESSVSWETGGTWDTSILDGSTYSGAIRLLPVSDFSIILETTVVYDDASEDSELTSPIQITSSNSWSRFSLPSIESDPLKTVESLYVTIHNESEEEGEIYIGGLDIRVGLDVDSFVVGDGYNSSWIGTANASRSVRLYHTYESKISTGAQIRYSAVYYLVDRSNVIQEDITQYVTSCSISIDLLAEATKGTITISLSDGDIILPFTDSWIRPHLIIEHSDGTVEGGLGPEGMLGLYSVEPASERYDVGSNTFTYQGFDLLWILQQQSTIRTPGSFIFDAEAGASFLMKPPYKFRQSLIDVFGVAGFTEQNGLLYLPNPGTDPPVDQVYSAETGTPLLDFITTMCDGMAWRRPWPTLQGQVTTEPIRELANEQPDYVFQSGPNSPVRWPFEIDPEPEDIANRVTVFGKWQSFRKAINEVVTNVDPAHPFSYVRLGRWIDAPQINAQLLNTVEEAKTIGMAELEKRGMLPYTARLKTRAMVCQLNSVYELNLTDFAGDPMANQNGQGKYWCIGWQITLAPPWEMTHNLRRIIPIFEIDRVVKFPDHVYISHYINNNKAISKLNKDIRTEKKKQKTQKNPVTKAQKNKLNKMIKDRKKLLKTNKDAVRVVTPIS